MVVNSKPVSLAIHEQDIMMVIPHYFAISHYVIRLMLIVLHNRNCLYVRGSTSHNLLGCTFLRYAPINHNKIRQAQLIMLKPALEHFCQICHIVAFILALAFDLESLVFVLGEYSVFHHHHRTHRMSTRYMSNIVTLNSKSPLSWIPGIQLTFVEGDVVDVL